MDTTQLMSSVLTVFFIIMLLAGLGSLIVSAITEYLIKQLFSLTTQAVKVSVVLLSFILAFIALYVYVIITGVQLTYPVLWVLGAFSEGIVIAMVCMNGYDTIYSYLYSGISKIFGSVTKK